MAITLKSTFTKKLTFLHDALLTDIAYGANSAMLHFYSLIQIKSADCERHQDVEKPPHQQGAAQPERQQSAVNIGQREADLFFYRWPLQLDAAHTR